MPRLNRPTPRVVHQWSADGIPQCGGKTKSESARGATCTRMDLNINNGRCPLHGGRSGRPNQHGRHSKIFRARLGQLFKAAAEDPQLLDMRHAIAALDAIAARWAERVSECDTREFRKRANALYAESRRLAAAANTEALRGNEQEAQRLNGEAARTMNQLGELLKTGVAEDGALAQARASYVHLARRIEGAWKVMLARQTAVTERDFVEVMRRIVDSIQRYAPQPLAIKIVDYIEQSVFDPALRQAELDAEFEPPRYVAAETVTREEDGDAADHMAEREGVSGHDPDPAGGDLPVVPEAEAPRDDGDAVP